MLRATSLLLLLAATVGKAEEDSQSKASAQVLMKLANTDSAIRPSMSNEPTRVKVQTYIRNMDVDDVNMRVLLDITYRMSWNDHRLAYNVEGVKSVVVFNPKMAWLPDAFFKNALTTQYESVHPESYLRVYTNGDLIYSTRLGVNLKCPMNLRRFPHDSQECHMRIASYGYTTNDLILEWNEAQSIAVSQSLHGGRFSLEKFETDNCHSKTATGEYSCVSVTLVVRRDFETYLLEWYLPTIFLIIVAWFSFFIPFEQFLGRLLLTLIPLIALASFTHTFTHGLASVPYIRAFDTFTGFSLCIIFLTLVHVVICYIKGVKSNAYNVEDEVNQDNPEEGGKSVDVAEPSGFRRLLQKVKGNAEFFSRFLLVSFYIGFLFVYFAAYCGTG